MSKSSVFQSVSVTESDLPNVLTEIQNSKTDAANSAAAAATSAASVATAASNAATEASNAGNEATAAANSATAAAGSASAAATSETNASAHVTSASNHVSSAANSATSATNSQAAATQAATNAATSETNAATSATNAATSATNAATSETNAATSANSAATSVTSAQAEVTNAQTEVTNATNQANAAATSAAAASSSASAASTSETNAQTHSNTASGHATSASTQATNAATSATNAATAETNAGTQATNAGTSATAAAGSATNAATAQTAAESARDSALAAFDSFDDRYLGSKTSDPSTDNDGNTLVSGTLYFNSSTSTMMLYTGSAWVAAYVSGGSFATLSGATFTGDVTVPNLVTAGNVDGRDVSADGAKLDGVATGATAVSSLTDLSISDGTNGQALKTDGAGNFSFGDVASSTAFADVTGKPTTIAGYGITDAFDGNTSSLTGGNFSSSGNFQFLNGGSAQNVLARSLYAGTSYSAATANAGEVDALNGYRVAGTSVINANRYIYAPRFYPGDGNDGFFYSDANGRTAFTGGDFYIQADVTNTYLYATNTYLGASSGDTTHLRGNTLSHNGFTFGSSGDLSTSRDIVSSARNRGIFGTYNSQKTDHIWSMGTSYRNHSSGSNFGNLYGLAYKHTNNGTGGNMASGHMMVWCQNGGGTAAMGTNIWTSGNVTAYSDIRVKTNIEQIPDALDKVCQLSGYTFDRTDVSFDDEGTPDRPIRQTGVIAQEVLEVLPEAVTGDEKGHYSVAYGNMVGLLIEAIKDLKAEVEELKSACCGCQS